jgi:hypothetical protein
VWLLDSFAVLSLLYRAASAPIRRRPPPRPGAGPSPASVGLQQPSAEVVTKRAQAERIYAELSADGAPVSAGQLAAAAGLSASYARALVAEFQARPPVALQYNGHPSASSAMAQSDPEATG